MSTTIEAIDMDDQNTDSYIPTSEESLGFLSDSIYKAQRERYELQHRVDELRNRETLLTNYLINRLKDEGEGGAVGQVSLAELKTLQEPSAGDWEAIRQYVVDTGDWAIVCKMLASAVLKEMRGKGVDVPGIKWRDVTKLSVTKK